MMRLALYNSEWPMRISSIDLAARTPDEPANDKRLARGHVVYSADSGHRRIRRRRCYCLALTWLLGALVLSAPAKAAQLALPVPIEQPEPEWPANVDAKHELRLALTIVVAKDGSVEGAEVEPSAGPELDRAAVEAVKRWRFKPATRDEVPVAAKIRVQVRFVPKSPPAPVEYTSTRAAAPAPKDANAPRAVTAAPSSNGQTVAPERVTETTAASVPEQPKRETSQPAAVPSDEQSIEITVHGRASVPSRGVSDFIAPVGELARVPRKNATALLQLAPGILLTNEGGEGHAEQVFLRGFDAREGQDIEFSVDGVPVNESGNLHGNGYADTHFIIPELVESLRVLEGPFDPRQGNYAVAGSASYELGLAQRGLTTKYTAGSWGTQRLLLLWGPQNENHHTFGGVELGKTDGYGKNRDAKHGSGMAQYEGSLGSHQLYRITAQAYATQYHTAGVIREDDYESGRIGFYDSYDLASFSRQHTPEGGTAQRYSISADLQSSFESSTIDNQIFFIQRDMRLLENFTGFLLDVQQPLQSLHDQRGDMLDMSVQESTIGARGFGRVRGTALGHNQQLELGYFARADQVHGTQQRIEAATGAPYYTEIDLQSWLGDLGLYADADMRATRWLAFRGGLRGDLFTFDVLNNCAVHDVSHPSPTNLPIDQSCLNQENLGQHREPNQRATTASLALLPRANVILGPFEGVTFSLGYGKGVRSIDPSYITQDIATPFASVKAWEGGAEFVRDFHDTLLLARSIFFQTHVDKDLIFSETQGRNVLGNGTTRTGWVGALRLTGPFFDESANVTLVKSAYDDTHLLVAYVPGVVVRSDSALFADLPTTIAGHRPRGALALGVTYVGPRPLPYGQRSDDILTFDGSASVAWRQFQIELSGQNLLDTRYRLGEYNYASDFHSQPHPTLVPERVFTAGAPRTVLLSLQINVGGTS
jgi:iron complex outermembrane recepter protein